MKQYRQTTGQQYGLGEAIPDLYTRTLEEGMGSYRDVIDRMDFTCLMAYHDDWHVAADVIRDELEYAEEVRKPLTVALLVSGSDHIMEIPNHMTFEEEGYEALNMAIGNLENTYRSFAGFDEVSIFIYEYYKDLKP